MAKSVLSDLASEADAESPSSMNHTRSKRSRFKSMAAQITSSPARLRARFDPTHRYDQTMDADSTSVEGLTDNKAFNIGLVFKAEHPTDDLGEKSKSFLQKGLHAIAHPQQAAKQQAANQVPDDPPFLSKEANADFLEANDELDRAVGVRKAALADGLYNDEMDQDVEEYEERVEYLRNEREAMKTAWITSRHVRRVRVVPHDYIPWPSLGDCQEIGQDGMLHTRYDEYGLKVVEYYCQNAIAPYVEPRDEMSFQSEVLLHIAERLFIVSAPWQTWIMKIREVYLWRDPWFTAKWLVGYVFLIKVGLVVPSLICYIIYIVLKSKYAPDHLDRLRESHRRTMDRGHKALKLSELFEQKGGQGWIDPIMDQFGPLLQQQSSDLADCFEVLRSFYHWQDERATWISLSLIVSAALFVTFTSVAYQIRALQLAGGLYFFGMRPIASLKPRYRRVVGVLKICFWDVPNTAETAFKHLHDKAAEVLERLRDEDHQTPHTKQLLTHDSAISVSGPTLIQADGTVITERTDAALITHPVPTHSPSRPIDIISFRGRHAGIIGRLIISTTSIRFMRSVDQTLLWTHPFADLVEMRKATSTGRLGKLAPTVVPNEGLSLLWTDGEKSVLEGMRKRDEAFNTIIGFSGHSFMQLHPSDEENVQVNGDEIIEGKRGWRPWRTQHSD